MFTQNSIKYILVIVLQLCCLSVFAGQVALTIDDLPFVGSAGKHKGKLRREKQRFEAILDTLQRQKVPATGFVLAGSIEQDQWELLERFKAQGNAIANHTYKHKSLNRTSAEYFINDIKKADEILAPIISHPKYFRYPFLATGRNCKTKLAVRNYLLENGYTIAPVTIDTKDYNMNQRLFNVPYRQRKSRMNSFRNRYINSVMYKTKLAEKKAMRIAKRPIKHILLIHMNYLNALFLEDLIKAFRDNGYEFITLTEALKDPFYKSDIDSFSLMSEQCSS